MLYSRDLENVANIKLILYLLVSYGATMSLTAEYDLDKLAVTNPVFQVENQTRYFLDGCSPSEWLTLRINMKSLGNSGSVLLSSITQGYFPSYCFGKTLSPLVDWVIHVTIPT